MSAFCCMSCLLIVPAIITYFSYVFGWQNPDQNRGGADNLSCYLVKDESRQKWNFYAGDQDKDVMEQSGAKYENHSDLFHEKTLLLGRTEFVGCGNSQL